MLVNQILMRLSGLFVWLNSYIALKTKPHFLDGVWLRESQCAYGAFKSNFSKYWQSVAFDCKSQFKY